MGLESTQVSFGELRAQIGRWFKEHARRALVIAVIGFAVGWVINVWVMAVRYDGYRAGPSALATADGNVVNGGLFFGVLSMVVVGVGAYGFGVGWSRFRSEVAAVPGVLAGLIRESGGRAWSLILWSAAILMLVSGVVAPGVSAVFGLGLLAIAPSALSQIAGRFFVRLWVEAVGFVAPAKRPRVSGLGGSLIGLTGGAAGLLIASQADTTSLRVVLAALMIGGAYLIVARPGMSAGVVVLFGGIGLAWVVTGALPAFADDGGWLEFQFSNPDANWWDWLTHPESSRVLILGVGGGLATGVGAATGGALGSVLSTFGAPSFGGTTWHDPNAPAAISTGAGSPVGTGPTTTTTIILEGDEARAALDAWRNRDPDQSPVIDIPEEEQWRVWASSGEGDPIIREGHIGTRGVVTGIGGVATGDDGSIVVIVDVEGFVPEGETPPPPIPLYPEPSTESGDAEASEIALDEPQPSEGEPEGSGGAGSEPEPEPGSDETGWPPVAEGDNAESITGEGADSPEPPADQEPPASGPEEPATQPDAEAEDPDADDMDAEQTPAEATADWARNALTGKVGPGTVDDISDFLTDPERTEISVPPRLEGIYGSIVSKPVNTDEGVRISLRGIGQVDLSVEDGRLVARAEAGALGRTVDLLSSLFNEGGSNLPTFDDVSRGVAGGADRINAAMESTGRTFTGVEALPDGSIRLVTASG